MPIPQRLIRRSVPPELPSDTAVVLLAGWWCAGKSSRIRSLARELPGLGTVDLMSTTLKVAANIGDPAAVSFNDGRFETPDALAHSYRSFEPSAYRMICSFLTKATRAGTRLFLVEAPPPFILWWQWVNAAFWLETSEEQRVKRIAKRLSTSRTEAYRLAVMQYQSFIMEPGSLAHVTAVKSRSTGGSRLTDFFYRRMK
jgi:hypothetical protein